jgi:hypothetical protein
LAASLARCLWGNAPSNTRVVRRGLQRW